MVILRDFGKHKYNLLVHNTYALSGPSVQAENQFNPHAGIIDTVANFVSQNKDTFKDVSKTVSSVSSASSNISQAIKAAKRFNELREASHQK